MPEEGAAKYAAEQPTANEQLVDSAIYHGLSLERVSSGMKDKIGALLKDAQEKISGKLVSGKLTDWQTQKAQAFLDWSNKVIAKTYDKIDGEIEDDLAGIKKAEIQKQINSVNQAVGMEISPAMSTQQLESIAKADELLVNGAVMSDWWQKQASNLQHNVLTTVQSGLVQGKSTQDIAKDLQTAMGEESVTVAQAKTLARTAAATVQSAAQQAYYDQNDDIIKGIRWVSTLDDRTTPQCQALDGLSWKPDAKGEMQPVGHELEWPGYPPIHWNCRSTTVPVLKSWQELSKVQLPHLKEEDVQTEFEKALEAQGFSPEEIANIEANQQASMDGQIPEAMNYEDWLKTKPEDMQKSILGPAKWQLWSDGKVSLMDMVKADTLQPLTVDELIATAEKNMAIPPPPPIPEGMHGLDLAERQILTAQMTSEATSGETWASWYNPNNGVTVDQTLKYSLTPQEAAQLAGQTDLVHLSNTASNAQLWGKSDAQLWSGQPGFKEAKLVTPSGRVITASLKAGKTWTEADAQKWALKVQEAIDEGIDDPYAQMRYAFHETGDKMILTQTEPGAIKLDSSTMKKVYGPVHEEDKPLSYLEAHTNQLELQKNAELAAAQAEIKAQMKVADQAAQQAAEESQLARQKQAELQQKIAEQRLAAAAQEQKDAAATIAKHEAEVKAAKAAADAQAARQTEAARAYQKAQDELAAIGQAQKEAEELEAKLAKKKKASEAAKKAAATKKKNLEMKKALAEAEAKAKEEALLAEQAAANQTAAAHQRAQDALWAAEQDKDTADKIYAAQQAAKAEADAQAKLVKAQKAAAKKAAQAAKAAAAPVNTHGQMDLAFEPKAEIKTNFPADPNALPVVKELGGYTHAQLVQDADGNLWVRKRGASPEHIASETLFDHLYNIAGVDIPESKLYSTPSGPVKLSRYIPDTQILGDYLKQASPTEKDRILGVVKNQFVANALFANWDAVGANPAAGQDNILIGKNGKAYMIDTGGAGEYKGVGTIMRGKFGPEVGELKTLLDPKINPTTAPVFKGITDQQIVDQSARILQVRSELLAATPSPLKAKLAARLDWLDNHVTEMVAEGKAHMPPIGLPPVIEAPPPPEVPKPALTPKGFPVDPMALKPIEDYPVGNGKGEVVQDAAGNKYLRRTGGNADALLDESRANSLMEHFGIRVPEHEMFEVNGQPVMLQKFIEGKTIDQFLATASNVEKNAVRAQMEKHFSIQALIGNTHVADGIRITIEKGKPVVHFVDNSGAFRYNVSGSKKLAGAWDNGQGVSELWTMRGKTAPHATTAPSPHTLSLLADMDIVQVAKQLEALPAAPPTTGDVELDKVLAKRWGNMRQIATGTLDADHFKIKTDWLENQSAARGNWKQMGVTDKLEDVGEMKTRVATTTGHPHPTPATSAFYLIDKNGKEWDDFTTGYSARAAAPPPSTALPNDKFYQPILTAVKSVNHKVGLNQPPNTAKLDAAIAHKHELELYAQHGTPDEKAMAAKYIPMIENLEMYKGHTVSFALPQFEQYEKQAVAAAPAPPRPAVQISSIPEAVKAEMNRIIGHDGGYNMMIEWAGSQAGSSQGAIPKGMRGLWDVIRDIPFDSKYTGGQSKQELSASAVANARRHGMNKQQAVDAMAIWHAFTQELLATMDLPNNDRTMRAVRLVRSEQTPTKMIDGTYLRDFKPATGSKQGMAIKGSFDSHSLVDWVHVYGQYDTATAMPHSLVQGLYFFKEGALFAGPSENEVAADGAGIPITVFATKSTGTVAARYSGPDATKWNLDISHLRP